MGTKDVDRVLAAVRRLRDAAVAHADRHEEHVRAADRRWRKSAENLLHYLSVRSRDIRNLQDRLSELGLSSLGRCEGHVLENLQSVLRMLGDSGAERGRGVSIAEGNRLIQRHAEDLLGSSVDRRGSRRGVRVLVTLPTAASEDAGLVGRLLEAGMDCARINCAHDDERTWARMIGHVRREAKRRGRECRVLMDLAGPKVRVGALPPGPRVMKLRPMRDELGRATRAVVVGLRFAARGVEAAAGAWSEPVDLELPMSATREEFGVRAGGLIRFTDARGSRRRMIVRRVVPEGVIAEIDRTAYVLSGTRMRAECDGREMVARVGELAQLPGAVVLRGGDLLRMSDDPSGEVGQMSGLSGDGATAAIACLPAGVLATVRKGEPVLFDDGKIDGVVRSVRRRDGVTRAMVEVTRARATGDRLREDKGVNLPETDLPVSSITPEDVQSLRFIAKNADIVAQSFVRTSEDIRELQARLTELGAEGLGMVAKIETRRAFAHLPGILLSGMRWRRFGVMIARGDLAVEVGYDRLAEVQEEILWLCEAAHVPVIWATQVLEGLASVGRPSRAEITDAAMSERAECVMLNKGPFILDAMRVLDEILRRMHGHQHKKVSRLRKLSVAQGLV